jgi:hypothetical protein
MINIEDSNLKCDVRLTAYEAMMAGEVGFRRQVKAMMRNSAPRFPEQYAGQLWYNHIAGACAELAVAKVLGLFWGGGVDTFDREDIEDTGYEVRFSPVGKPKVMPRDSRIVIGVIGNAPSIIEFTIIGWLQAEDAKREEWKSPTEPVCYFPPKTTWHPIEQLRTELAQRGHLR